MRSPSDSRFPTERSEGAGRAAAVAAKQPKPDSRLFRIAVLASGRGSNLQALIDAVASGRLQAKIVGMFSDRAQAPALARAAAAGIAAKALHPGDFATRQQFDEALFSEIERVQPDLIVCAGYMRLISAVAVRRAQGRVINIHPSLLPSYPGLRTHVRVLADGVQAHGASVHYVIPALDAGPVIAQAHVPVAAGDTPQTLAARVLEREHPLLVETVRLIATGRVRQDGLRILVDNAPLTVPLRLDAHDRLLPEP